MTTNTQQLATLLDQVMANLLGAECRQWLSDARKDISHASTALSKATRILADLLQQEPIATVLPPDPLDERDGPYLHLAAWERLRALPAGSKLYASPLIQPGQAPAGMALIRLDHLQATRRALEDCRRLISHIGGFDADYCADAEARLKEIDEALAAAGSDQHPDDAAVDRFAVALKTKMARSRAKGRGGWDNAQVCSVEDLARMLIEHLGKGNSGTFEDVATFAMMLHQRGANPAVLAEAIQARDAAAKREGWADMKRIAKREIEQLCTMLRTNPPAELRATIDVANDRLEIPVIRWPKPEHPFPAFTKPSLLKDCDVQYSASSQPSPAPELDDQEYDRNAERLTLQAFGPGAGINPEATSIDDIFIDEAPAPKLERPEVAFWRDRILAAHPGSDPRYWPDALLVQHMTAEIADLRAAQARPSVDLEHIGSLISVFRNATRDDANNGGREYFESARNAERELREAVERIVGALRDELDSERDLVKVLQEQNDALRSTAEDAQAGQVPEGWKPVPIEPTEDLLEAIHRGGYVGDDEELRWFYKSILDASPVAQAPEIQVRKLGIYGKAYDLPETKRAYTYAEQPDNLGASRLGRALSETVQVTFGDHIDGGLALLRALEGAGFGVFELADAPQPAGGDHA
ncbi:hypothetical protein VV867_12580 [Pseudomonas sp. JH-2]|uniref:hypothetical protein n=1 Tax=Pseudomonas sp. JH-2 TaxID=3114998 RepID=UPI002E2680EE|nr:hypothetical protein [Pseudomonas sp. JH-2]